MFRILFLSCFLFWGSLAPALALDPDEPLSDPVLETRARALSQELRCVVCQNQSIDESDADLARAMRLMVRKRLVAGDSDSDIVQALQDRYGDAIRLMPPFKASTYLLWAAPFLFAGLGLWGWRRTLRLQPEESVGPTEVKTENRSTYGKPSGLVTGCAALIVLCLSAAAYAVVGHPTIPDQPFIPRLAAKLGVTERAITDMQAMTAQLTARIEQKPNDGEAWLMLGRANRYLDRHGEAVFALKRAVAQGQNNPAVLSDLGESLVLYNGQMTSEAKALFAKSLLQDPTEPRAAWFVAMTAAQDGKKEAAIGILRRAAAALPPNSVWSRRLSLQAERLQITLP